MDRETAEKIIKILLTADGGCEYCVSDLLDLFCKEFPEYREIAEKAFRETFSKELNNFDKNNASHKKRNITSVAGMTRRFTSGMRKRKRMVCKR